MRKKLFLLLFAIVAGTTSLWASDIEVDGIWYDFIGEDGIMEACVTYQGSSYDSYSNEYSGNVVIPSSVTYNGQTYSVVSIGSFAFAFCHDLLSITIPESVSWIGASAFESCDGLTSVTIPESVSWIGKSTFAYCSGMTSIIIPNSVTSIEESAFKYCTNLTSVTIPNSVTNIEASAFESCDGLTSVTIPESVSWIGKSAFAYCSGLTSATIGNNVTSIGESAFKYCTNLTSVTIPNSVTSISTSTFENCTNLTSVTIPNSVTSIGDAAFKYCTVLTNVTIPNSITEIGNDAFYHCSGLTSIDVPNSVTHIGNYAFSGCTGLTYVTISESVNSIWSGAFASCTSLTAFYVDASNPKYCDIDGVLFNKAQTELLQYPNRKSSEYTIPDCVSVIGYQAFYKCSDLTSITIPNSVTTIRNNAFCYCTELTSVNIPNSVTSIGDDTFSGCSNLPVDNNLRYADTYLVNAVDKTLSSYVIKEGTKWIGQHAFSGCNNLTSFVIPNSVTRIGDYASQNCIGLTSVVISKSVTSIGDYAFRNCSNLSKIYAVPTSRPTIGSNTFSGIASDAVVYVSNEAVSNYMNSSSSNYWKKMNIVGMDFFGVEKSAQATSVSLTTTSALWDTIGAYIVSCSKDDGEQQAGNVLECNGLEPETEYTDVEITLTSNTGETETINVSYTTSALELTTQASQAVNSTTALLFAETNISNAETSCGFEWKRYNAPDEMAGTKVYCPVANGTMAGRLKNLNPDVYYKYRAFYQSTAGNMYYGEWQYIFTGDATVEFDPMLYTYAATAVTETSATIKGYALAGSVEFTEQGFEFWVEARIIPEGASGAPARAYNSAIGEHQTVTASGISMKVTLTNLDEGSIYKYRTYAVANGQKVYGAEQAFTTRGEYLYTVTFVDWDGTILGSDKVHYGTAATAPDMTDAVRDGYDFAGWDVDFSTVTDDITVNAVYSIATAIEPVESSAIHCGATKFIRDGQLLILRDGKTYTIQGQEVK